MAKRASITWEGIAVLLVVYLFFASGKYVHKFKPRQTGAKLARLLSVYFTNSKGATGNSGTGLVVIIRNPALLERLKFFN